MFGEWIAKIVGLGALGVLLDVILPDGETNKYIKGIFGIITVFVLFSPLPKLLDIKINVDDLTHTSEAIELDEDYTYYVWEKRWEDVEESLGTIYSEKYGTKCEVDVKFVETCPQKIDVVYFYFKNSVIEGFEPNKYKLEVLEDVASRLNIKENLVVVRYE